MIVYAVIALIMLVFIAYGVRVAWYILSGEYQIDERIRGVK